MTSPSNPFVVVTPEDLDPERARKLFVETFSDFPQIKRPCNTMIVGPRGSGKSMMIRCLLPDVLLLNNSSFRQLEFVAFHVSIKKTSLRYPELDVLDNQHASHIINEHFMIITVLLTVFESLLKLAKQYSRQMTFDKSVDDYFNKVFARKMKLFNKDFNSDYKGNTTSATFAYMYEVLEELHTRLFTLLSNLDPVNEDRLPKYNGPLFTYNMFLVPLLDSLKHISWFPQSHIFLFIDDADNLSKTQTQVLNSWLASRTQPSICIKVSTQVKSYKSYLASNSSLVEAPHDYQEVNIADKYTTSKSTYYKRVKQIVKLRLEDAGISAIEPEQFFPEYDAQVQGILAEADNIRNTFSLSGKGYREADDVLRYARPNYIMKLGGTRKSKSTYSYSGFEQLVHLSSGVIRHFLDSAAKMYDECLTSSTDITTIRVIPHSIQSKISREQAEFFMFQHFEKLRADDTEPIKGDLRISQKLRNLVNSLGKTFHDLLVHEGRSERRVFSFALSNKPTSDIEEVLVYGVRLGYFHEASIGNKDGTGRTYLYIMNRILAPFYVLDPTSFAGYLFVSTEALSDAINNGRLLRHIASDSDIFQLNLFD